MQELLVYPFTCQKHGNTPEENEDAYAVPDAATGGKLFRFAVADGATESSFSREWARVLVDHFYTFEYNETNFMSSLHPILKKSWLKGIDQVPLPWYAQEKLELGSFSSFLGLDINQQDGHASISAVGDSNFFHFKGKELQLSFPISRAADFGNRPFLLSTEAYKNKREPLFERQKCMLTSGDWVVLATDALSHWILKAIEDKNAEVVFDLIALLQQPECQETVSTWIEQRRSEHAIKNDDSTIVLIKIV